MKKGTYLLLLFLFPLLLQFILIPLNLENYLLLIGLSILFTLLGFIGVYILIGLQFFHKKFRFAKITVNLYIILGFIIYIGLLIRSFLVGPLSISQRSLCFVLYGVILGSLHVKSTIVNKM